jgi:prepilin-type N-terminal cleavage/methylation domain-containing protein
MNMDVTGARRRRTERGDTLIEIIIALVIIGGVVSAFFAAYGTSATASSAHRDLVTADAVIRGYAEETKDAVRSCVAGGEYTVMYAPREGFSVDPAPGTARPCPPPESPERILLTITLPNGQERELEIVVRTP